MAIVKAQYPRTWSKRHRMSVPLPTTIKAVVLEDPATAVAKGPVVMFWMQDHDFLYDEYPTENYDTNSGNCRLREIPGRVVFHEIGSGTQDYLTNVVLLEAQEIEPLGSDASPDYHTDFYTYDATTFNEPKLSIALRSQGYLNKVDKGQTIDLVKLNMQAWGDTNIYAGIRQTPGTMATGQSYDETGTARESIRLNTPMSKFRTARMTFESAGYTIIIRSVSFIFTDYGRKQYG